MRKIKYSLGKIKILLWTSPPLLAIFGYGGVVCYDSNGSLNRINKIFGNIPK